jgi:hypothetical protein
MHAEARIRFFEAPSARGGRFDLGGILAATLDVDLCTLRCPAAFRKGMFDRDSCPALTSWNPFPAANRE